MSGALAGGWQNSPMPLQGVFDAIGDHRSNMLAENRAHAHRVTEQAFAHQQAQERMHLQFGFDALRDQLKFDHEDDAAKKAASRDARAATVAHKRAFGTFASAHDAMVAAAHDPHIAGLNIGGASMTSRIPPQAQGGTAPAPPGGSTSSPKKQIPPGTPSVMQAPSTRKFKTGSWENFGETHRP